MQKAAKDSAVGCGGAGNHQRILSAATGRAGAWRLCLAAVMLLVTTSLQQLLQGLGSKDTHLAARLTEL